MLGRHQVYVNTREQRDAICDMLLTFKKFKLIGYKSRWYVNAVTSLPFVDVIYA